MQATAAERTPRRIAVIIGAGGSGRSMLDLLPPLLLRGRGVEMQGIFLEEAEIQHAAELPFVQELCRVTFSVREFNSDQFERALALRMRSARRALALLARRAGVVHTFRNVRGSAIKLLLEAATSADILVFEPARRMSAPAPRMGPETRGRIAVAVSDVQSGRMALSAALHLAEQRADRLSVLLAPGLAENPAALTALFPSLRSRPGRIVAIPGATLDDLVAAARVAGAGLLVIAATDEVMAPAGLHTLREKLRCPICLVRHWDQNNHEDVA